MIIIRQALRLLRLASELLFCFEVNRFLGRAVKGPIRHRLLAMRHAESALLQQVRAKTTTVEISLPTGIRIHTIIAGAAITDPQAPGPRPLVLLHGHSMAAAFFFRNIDHFLDMGFSSVFIPDLPGWGSSSRPRFQGTLDAALDFFLTPFNHWIQSIQLSTFALCGHSMGAYLAHEFTIRAPHVVTRLILASPAAITRHMPLSTALWFAFTPQRFLTHGGLLAHIFFTTRYPSKPAYNTSGFRQFTLCSNSVAHRSGDAAAAALVRFSRIGPTAWRSECARPLLETVTRIPCSIEIVAGDRDDLVNVDAVHALYVAMLAKGNTVRLNFISGADHTPHICAPLKFAKALMRGFSDLSTTGVHRYVAKAVPSVSPNLLLV